MSGTGCSDVARFIELFCHYQGIERERIGENVFRFWFDGEPVTYTHQPDLIGADSAEFITYGHPVLDRLISSARSQGWAANLIYPLSAKDYAVFREKLARIPVKGIHLIARQPTIIYHAKLVFLFRLSLLADLRKDLLISLAADPETDQVEIWELPKGLCSLPEGFRPLPDRRRYPRLYKEKGSLLDTHLANLSWFRETDYRTFQLYRQACLFLHRWILESFSAFEKEQLARLKCEEQVLDEYYDTLLREEMKRLYELLHKAAVLEVRVALAKTAQTRELFNSRLEDYRQQIQYEKDRCSRYGQMLAREKSKRLHELRRKYTPQALVTLVSAARVYLPRAVFTVESRLNECERIRLVYDFCADAWLDLQCQRCERPTYDLMITSEAGLLCSRCAEVCEVCGQPTMFPAAVCPGCGQKICQYCRYSCLLPSATSSTDCLLCCRCGPAVCPCCVNLLSGEEILD